MRAEVTASLRDGMNAALRLAAAIAAEPEGRAARRRAFYYTAYYTAAAHGDLRTRLECTTVTGVPVGLNASPLGSRGPELCDRDLLRLDQRRARDLGEPSRCAARGESKRR